MSNESAAEYGRYEGCFIDHHGAPYTFQDVMPTTRPADSAESLISPRQELRPARISQPTIQPEEVHCADATLEVFLGESNGSALPPLLWHPFSTCQGLKLPCNDIDLGSNPLEDVKSYERDLAIWNHIDFSETWLPLSWVDSGSGGGLPFPPGCERMRLLLLRELDREKVVLGADSRLKILDDMRINNHGSYPGQDLSEPHCFRTQKISPPLSPIPEHASPFIPDREVCVIDLTSEPDSFGDLSESRACIIARDDDHDFLKKNRTPPADTLSQVQHLPGLPKARENLRLEVPLLTESSDDPFEVLGPVGYGLSETTDRAIDTRNCLDATDHLLVNFFEDRSMHARRMVEHESLDTLGCILRLPIPTLDFDTQAAEWTRHGAVAEKQYAFLRDSLAEVFRLNSSRSCNLIDTSLKWNPVPKGSGNDLPRDSPVLIDDDIQNYLLIKAPTRRGNREQETRMRSMSCFQVSQADVQDLSFNELSGMTVETVAPYNQSRSFASPNGSGDQRGAGNSGNGRSTTSGSCFPTPGSRTILKNTNMAPLDVLCSQKFKRKRRRGAELGVLRDRNQSEATGNLLGAFMQLRGQKRPRPYDDPATNPSQDESVPTVPGLVAAQESGASVAAVPAFTPTIHLPNEKACYITSLNLGRAVLKHLDSCWPKTLLIDRDFDRHKTNIGPHGSSKFHGALPLCCQDADIALTPCVGVVVTNVLQAAQKPLPGSKEQAPLQQHLEEVCGKYDTVLVLVSENNAEGELSSPLGPAASAAYANFVQFSTTLFNECTCIYVPGASQTLARWILWLMCIYSPQALAYKDLLNPVEMSWELFLRRAGMNVIAAQVLAGSLSNYGPSGLSRFLAMSTQEKLTEFGDLVGKRALVRASQTLDRRWS